LANSVFSLRDVDAYHGDSPVLQRVSFDLGEVMVESTLAEVLADPRTREDVYLGE
jgi:hypothetical protein